MGTYPLRTCVRGKGLMTVGFAAALVSTLIGTILGSVQFSGLLMSANGFTDIVLIIPKFPLS